MFFTNPKRTLAPYTAFFAMFAIVVTAFAPVASAQKIRKITPADDYQTPGILAEDLPADTVEPETVCSGVAALDGSNSNSSNTYGNIRTYTSSTPDFRVSGWQKLKAGGAWNTAFLGHYGAGNGVGVTDRTEGDGSNGRHRVDNLGDAWNYVMIRFDRNVTVDQISLASVDGDSDITVWIGSVPNAYTDNTMALSDALLASFGPAETNTGGGSDRIANVNASGKTGNVLVVAARVDDPATSSADRFKIENVVLKCPTGTASLTIIKEVSAPLLGDKATQAFSFTTTGTGMVNFALTDNNVVGPDRHTRVFTSFGSANTVTVTEVQPPSWSLLGLNCTTTGAASDISWNFGTGTVTFTPQAGVSATCTYTNGLLTPSAARTTISGRATLANGRGVSGATLTLFDVQTGESRVTRTNSFGYYMFNEVEVDKFYVVTISHSRYSFAENTRQFTLMSQLADMNFTQAF